MNHVDAGHHFEQLAADMGRGSVAARCHVDLSRIGLGVSNELGQRFCWNRGMNFDDVGYAHQACDRRDVAKEIEIELVVEGGIDGVRRIDQ